MTITNRRNRDPPQRDKRRSIEVNGTPGVGCLPSPGKHKFQEEAAVEPIGYRGIAFMPTGRAALLLENGDWLTLTA